MRRENHYGVGVGLKLLQWQSFERKREVKEKNEYIT